MRNCQPLNDPGLFGLAHATGSGIVSDCRSVYEALVLFIGHALIRRMIRSALVLRAVPFRTDR